MSVIPQRPSRVRQVADYLGENIKAGVWGDWIPGERELAATLQVGRNTLRAALGELAAAGVIKPCHGSGHRILRTDAASQRPRSTVNHTIGLLTPGPLHALKPRHALWVDRLRALLIEQGLRLHTHHGEHYTHVRASAARQRLLRQHVHDAWVLALCDEPVQRWFESQGIPCVLAGSTHEGVALPSIDIDHFALCRHAVGHLRAHGHRRIVYLTRPSRYAGDFQSELGFLDGASLAASSPAQAHIVHHADSVAGVGAAVRRLLRSRLPPTALLVGDSFHYLTVITVLASLGLRVPQDISLVCRDDDRFLSHLVPPPARYSGNPDHYAAKLLGLIQSVTRVPARKPADIRLLPALIKGGSVAKVVPE